MKECNWKNIDYILFDGDFCLPGYHKGYVYFITESGNILGKPDYTRLENAKWYQKILSKLFWRYKKRFEDIHAIKATFTEHKL